MAQAQASILAVGTELTLGEITNRNAAHLSKKLTRMGIPVTFHRTVPDDPLLMEKALEEAKNHSQLVFVTGGLGPTPDDRTREVIGNWTNEPLEFDAQSWSDLQSKLLKKGVNVTPLHRKQCYFPKNAKRLPNRLGTADGFSFKSESARFYVLPGPRAEIDSIWKNCIEECIASLYPEQSAYNYRRWKLLSIPESKAAKIADDIFLNSGVEVGFRLDYPYVDLRIKYPQEDEQKLQKSIELVERRFRNFIASRENEDLAYNVALFSSSYERIRIIDFATNGHLQERFNPQFRKPKLRDKEIQVEFSTFMNADEKINHIREQVMTPNYEDVLTFFCPPLPKTGKWQVGIKRGLRVETKSTDPKFYLKSNEKLPQALSEIALQAWWELFKR